jgi:hypothetical protein
VVWNKFREREINKMTEFWCDDDIFERLWSAKHSDENIGLLFSTEHLDLIGRFATDKFIVRNDNNLRILFQKKFRLSNLDLKTFFTIQKIRSE